MNMNTCIMISPAFSISGYSTSFFNLGQTAFCRLGGALYLTFVRCLYCAAPLCMVFGSRKPSRRGSGYSPRERGGMHLIPPRNVVEARRCHIPAHSSPFSEKPRRPTHCRPAWMMFSRPTSMHLHMYSRRYPPGRWF
ncbi:hypothetical protein C8T65DRAFT_34344 [Cerioporus squamosus]|nr:hypothetical protein C8T65DRAFT_34344 [Cerioporus squamosus]